jgi:hypothetical protein
MRASPAAPPAQLVSLQPATSLDRRGQQDLDGRSAAELADNTQCIDLLYILYV